MKIRRAEDIQVFNLSMLDVITSALGAVVILFVLVATTASKGDPMLFGIPLETEDALFLVDVSQSMEGQEERLVDTAMSLVTNLELDRFRFAFFDSEVYSDAPHWPHGWLEGTRANKEMTADRLRYRIDRLVDEPPGMTDTHEALMWALAEPEVEVIFLITDGAPSAGVQRPQQILDDVAAANVRDVQIDVVMVGLPENNVNELYDFLHDLAQQNGGDYVGR